MEFLSSFNSWCSGPGFFQGAGHGWGGGFMPFHMGSIFQLLIIGLIIYFVVRMLKKPATPTDTPSPEAILKRRYAAGEIDEQTYKSMKNDLK